MIPILLDFQKCINYTLRKVAMSSTHRNVEVIHTEKLNSKFKILIFREFQRQHYIPGFQNVNYNNLMPLESVRHDVRYL